MPSPFVHLHCHSEYSVLDGACRVEELVKKAVALEMPAVTITDHGSMAGAIQLYRSARKAGIKPILGCEVYVVAERRAKEPPSHRAWGHLTLLAETLQGYQNLVKLVTFGYLEGYHYKPRVDFELMERYSEGIIALSGCLSSPVNKALLEDDLPRARDELDRLVQIFGRDDVYVEIQDAGLPEHRKVNEGLLTLAAETGLPLVGTGDVHYLEAGDADPHEVLLCIQTADSLANEKRFRFPNKEFFFKDPREMADAFRSYGHDLLRPTLEIAERCSVEIELGAIRLPRFDVPNGADPFEHLRRLCDDGLVRRYETITDELRKRLRFELETIRTMGFADYFLIVHDFVRFAKSNQIGVGPGRGSAAGSLVAYCLEITDIDPIRYELLFERFLNPDRASMPDVDIDFSVRGRERVMNYVVEKYGREQVAQIITFGRLAAKAATRDTARVLGLPFGVADRVAKLIPEGPKVSFESCLAKGQELRSAYDDDAPLQPGMDVTTRSLVDMARPLEGLVRQDGIHAAAVVISDRPLYEYLPLQRKGVDAELVTQYAMKDVEALGLLKMDFLGLRNLDVIDEAIRLVAESRGIEIDWTQVPLDDASTYEMLARGDAIGIFQFESTGMRDALRQVRPTVFEDLIALVALYRPGPMVNIPVYARRKNGHEEVTFLDPRLEAVQGGTYGITIYQEQSMQIAKSLGGFTPGEADTLRRAISKKDAVLMASLKPKFVAGAVGVGVSERVAEELWLENERSADYSFNKSHAACYALLSYRTAYLKANFPEEYMAALISSVMDTKDKVPFFVAECAEMGIDVLPPDISQSMHDFAVVEGKIRFGLSAVKGVGTTAVLAMVQARNEGGPFASIWDFCERVSGSVLNAKVIDALIRAGALDSTGATRRGMLMVAEQAIGSARKSQADRHVGQFSIFELNDGPSAPETRSYPPVPGEEFDATELLRLEREVLGLYLSSHPLGGIRKELEAKVDTPLRELGARRQEEAVTVGGLVSGVRQMITKKGDTMAFVQLEDMTGSCEVVVFAKPFEAARSYLAPDRVVIVRGRADVARAGEAKVVAWEVLPYEAVAVRTTVRVRIDARTAPHDTLERLRGLISEHRGEHSVVLELSTSQGPLQYRLGPGYRVDPSQNFFAEVQHLVGDAILL